MKHSVLFLDDKVSKEHKFQTLGEAKKFMFDATQSGQYFLIRTFKSGRANIISILSIK